MASRRKVSGHVTFRRRFAGCLDCLQQVSCDNRGKIATTYPSEELIRRLAEALDTDVDELFLLAKKFPEPIRQRVMERPDAFRKFASLDDDALNKLLKDLDHG